MSSSILRLFVCIVLMASACVPDEFIVGEADASTTDVISRDVGANDAGANDVESSDAGSDAPRDVLLRDDAGADVAMPDAPADVSPDVPNRFADAGNLGACPLPQLLVAIQTDNASSVNGRIARYSLYPDVERCPDLIGEGRISWTAEMLSVASPGQVVVTGADNEGRVVVIDVETDTVEWEYAHENLIPPDPLQAFMLEEPGGETRLAVTFGYGDRNPLGQLRLFDDTGNVLRDINLRDSSFAFASRLEVAAVHPLRAERFLALTNESSVLEIDIFTGAFDAYYPNPTEVPLLQFQAYNDGVLTRSTWLGLGAEGVGVYYFDSTSGRSSSNPLLGPIYCLDRGEVLHPCTTPERLTDAIADPTRPGRFFAICRGAGIFESHVVQFEAGRGTCEVVLNDAELGDHAFNEPQRLAIILE